jgi:hypothetical protein
MSSGPERPRSVLSGDGGVVLDINGGRLFSLNATGLLIFRLLEQGISERKIVEELANRFSISSNRAQSDFAEFCGSLEGLAVFPRRENSTQE